MSKKFIRKLGERSKIFIFLLFFFFVFANKSSALDNAFVVIVNPVRGDEFFDPKPQDFLKGFKIQKQLIDSLNLSTTWLLRFDILNSPSISNFKSISKNQELGIFLEITPSLAKAAEISYPEKGIFWHDANKIFLSGFRPEERIKLIDVVFEKFKNNFGYYPKSVGAWHVDSYSADYMKRKYGISGVLICADQFGTDGYQVWGGWWGVPFYPSRFNILTPAQTAENKLDVVVYWWAARDPQLGYGGSVEESTYSVQANDYLGRSLGIEYFRKLLDVYLNDGANQFGQLTIGLENDNNWQKIGSEFALQMEEISSRQKKGELKVLTMQKFTSWYQEKFKKMSPPHQINGWMMTPEYRVGLSEENGERIIRDLRVYNERWPEANLLTANPWGTLSLNNPYKIDSVRFESSAVKANFDIKENEVIKRFDSQKIPFKISIELLLSCYLAILLGTCLLCKNIPLLLLILIGSISISVPMIKSGLIYDYGMGFWGPNGHDGIWHIALINQLTKFSLGNPVFSGAEIANYHFGFDFLAAILSRVTGIIPVNIYFQVLPPTMAILIGVLTYKFVEKWSRSKKSAWWAAFFVYFGGSWGWLVSIIRTGRLGGESIFWANQAISTLINPPYALSLVVLLMGLIVFLDYLKNPNKKNLICCGLLFGLLIQIKVYAGVIVLGSLFFLSLFTLLLRRNRVRELLILFTFVLLTSLVVFLPLNIRSTSLLVFSLLWFPRTMLAYSDRFGWFKLENARVAYLNSGKWPKLILAEGLALLIFIIGNLGTRVIGLIQILRIRKIFKLSVVDHFLLFFSIISLILPLLFIQKGNSWNTIQFFYYFQFIMAIFAGVVIGNVMKLRLKFPKYHILRCGIVLVAGLTLMTTVTTLKNDYLPSRPPARISVEELEALDFLKRQPEGIILTFPYNPDWKVKFSEPRPLYAYETTAYVSALSGKQTFLEDEMNMEIIGFDWKNRRQQEQTFFLTADHKWANDFLSANKIKYLYLVKGQRMNLGLGDIGADKIFENGETVIYQIK